MPLSAAQARTLVGAAFSRLLRGQRVVSAETARWRQIADAIPDRPLREGALRTLTTKRGHSDGAALFAMLAPRRDPTLLRLLVAYELIWDYLDSTHEMAPDERNGLHLHLAMVDAIERGGAPADWYRYHPWRDDGGFLAALVRSCRDRCRSLPSYRLVRPTLVREARRSLVSAFNHLTDPLTRDARLRAWAAREYPGTASLEWYELSGAASASLVHHALLALAADPATTTADVEEAYAAYSPWVTLATTMLDSYVDQVEDAHNGDHSYIAHYPSREVAAVRVREAIERAGEAVLGLRNGHRHAVIVACMIAMYLSKDSARTPELRETTGELIRAGGMLTQVLVPVLRLWRIHYDHRAA